jgi:hypothetical protein
MSDEAISKYGAALTGSDWVGLPMRIGQVPEQGSVEDLLSESDAILGWSGGPSDVEIEYLRAGSTELERAQFRRLPGGSARDPVGPRNLARPPFGLRQREPPERVHPSLVVRALRFGSGVRSTVRAYGRAHL